MERACPFLGAKYPFPGNSSRSWQGAPWLQAWGGIATLFTRFTIALFCERCYPWVMKTIITAKVKLKTTKEQFEALRATQLAYRNALNTVSQYAYEHGKMSNQQALQRSCYDEIRTVHKLPAQMACNVPRQVGATYKGLWSKVKQNALARKTGLTKKRYKGLDQAPKYVSPTLTYNYNRDFTLKKEQQVSILTLAGRLIVPYTGYS